MKEHIRDLISQALAHLINTKVLTPGLTPAINVEHSKDNAHGDYASNIALLLAKPCGMQPRALAELIRGAIPPDEQVARIEIAGPGFLNFFQNSAALAAHLMHALKDPKLGVAPRPQPERVVVDLSSPNLAKEMHVGHLRSTIIGDAVARVLTFLGDTVIRQNHVGDWGTQFGMLLAFLEEHPESTHNALADLEQFYRAAKLRFDQEPLFAARARTLVVALQAGDPKCLALWERFNRISLSHCQAIYDQLGVQLGMDDVRGESAYNQVLPEIVATLRAQGLLTQDQGALCVFLAEFANSEGSNTPIIVQKADGGYLYATTDLAALQYRSQTLQAARILYFVDQRQALHFQMIFALAKRAGLVKPDTRLEHMGFGTMNGSDGRPFKTRDGGTVKLAELLAEAQARAYQLVAAKNPAHPPETLKAIANAVGISSVKYADLSKHRTSDYNFQFEQMLSFEGNTAPYLLYAYTRVASLCRKSGRPMADIQATITLEAPAEYALAQQLVQFNALLHSVADKGTPHLLCSYLYQLATLFSSFYEQCPILNQEQSTLRESRLALAALTGRTLHQGLVLLGLQPLEQM